MRAMTIWIAILFGITLVVGIFTLNHALELKMYVHAVVSLTFPAMMGGLLGLVLSLAKAERKDGLIR